MSIRDDLPRTVRRTVQLSALPVGSIGDKLVGLSRRVGGADADTVRADLRQRAADRMRSVLGDAKGGALKAGQLLSTVDALFPADPDATWARALAALPADNPALPFALVEPVLAAELGDRWRRRFDTFEERAVAAASIGQVHRATLPDGRAVAVKVQYPDVAEALKVDLAIVSVMTRLASTVAPGMALPPLVAEMRERLVEELDYRREADVQRAFATAHADNPGVVIPAVHLATRRVLVMDWLDGIPFTALATGAASGSCDGRPATRQADGHDVAERHRMSGNDDGRPETRHAVDHAVDQGTRDAAGRAWTRFLLSGPELAGWLHTDQHPGNFRWFPPEGQDRDPDDPRSGRLGVLDFGSALPMPDGMPRTFGRLISLLREEDAETTLAGLRAEGFVRPGADVDAVKLRDYLAPFSEPSRHDTFTFSPEWLQGQFGRLGDPRNPDFAVALQLTMPAEHLFTHRVWLGIVGVLCRLHATLDIEADVRRWLPGLE